MEIPPAARSPHTVAFPAEQEARGFSEMLKFYFNGSPNPTKVAFLEEAGIAYQPVAVDTRAGDQFKPEYLAVNPNAKVPAIDDDGVKVFDSNAILLYLCKKDRQPRRRGRACQPRRTAVLADAQGRHRRRPVQRPGRPLRAALFHREDRLRPATSTRSRRRSTSASSTIIWPRAAIWSATTTPSSTWTSGWPA